MLTIDDINSINQKYGDIGFWYKIDLTKCTGSVGTIYDHDIVKVKYIGNGGYFFKIDKSLFHGVHYCLRNGTYASNLSEITQDGWNYQLPQTNNPCDTVYLFLTTDNDVNVGVDFGESFPTMIPLSELRVPLINGEFDDKFYFKIVKGTPIGYIINGNDVESETDEKGTFIRLPSADDCIVGVKSSTQKLPMYKVTFKEFKTLPLFSIPMMYANNKQQIQLFNSETGEYITDFQAYYKGELLVDNMFNVPSVSDGENGYIPITIDLLDNRYPICTLKMKIPIKNYVCSSQQEVETALATGISYFYIQNTSIVNMDFSNVTLRISIVHFINCTFNDCKIRVTGTCYDDGNNAFNNTAFTTSSSSRRTLYGGSNSIFNNCTAENIIFRNYDLHFTGTLKDCRTYNTVIISDGDIEITGTLFQPPQTRKTYFPAFLYLTGDYTLQNNTFTMTATFTELQFNMCLIKATNDFNVGEFINKNTFNLNIEYETENPSTLYYNIVDDDKIRARRLS